MLMPAADLDAANPEAPALLQRQALYERVLSLWFGGRHDTHAIALEVSVDEAEVCRIIEEARAHG